MRRQHIAVMNMINYCHDSIWGYLHEVFDLNHMKIIYQGKVILLIIY